MPYHQGENENQDPSVLFALLEGHSKPILKTDYLVRSLDGSGLGKIVSVDESDATVEFFHSVSQREIKKIPHNMLLRGYLSPQTRVYCQDKSDNWAIGRVRRIDIQDDRSIEYEVQFPNSHFEYIGEVNITPRCDNPEMDAAEVLACFGMETPFFFEARQRILHYLNRFHAASSGMSGLLSSSVELVSHQIDVIRRVLNDSQQRYLLSDEVGMGKTIEAGAIIRQNLIDNQELKVAVIVPVPLVNQWESELVRKFSAYHFSGRLGVYSFEEAFEIHEDVDYVVIDEAHHLFEQDNEGALSLRSKDKILQIAQKAKNLLLLTATPVL